MFFLSSVKLSDYSCPVPSLEAFWCQSYPWPLHEMLSLGKMSFSQRNLNLRIVPTMETTWSSGEWWSLLIIKTWLFVELFLQDNEDLCSCVADSTSRSFLYKFEFTISHEYLHNLFPEFSLSWCCLWSFFPTVLVFCYSTLILELFFFFFWKINKYLPINFCFSAIEYSKGDRLFPYDRLLVV